MESRKYQLQKQIKEALKANDNELYSLLKSQWAHRFGVESLEELKSLDLNQFNQNPINVDVDNQKIDQPQEKLFKTDKPNSTEEYDNQEKEIKTSTIESIKHENNESFKIKSNEIVDKVIYNSKPPKQIKENNENQIVPALIPLPPKPKYSYLKKWLLRSK